MRKEEGLKMKVFFFFFNIFFFFQVFGSITVAPFLPTFHLFVLMI